MSGSTHFEGLSCLHLKHQAVQVFFNCSDSEEEGTTVLENVANCSTNDTVSQAEKPDCSATPMWEPQMLQMTGLHAGIK
jgi:uncharacterized protein YgiB involved in biofilm formation